MALSTRTIWEAVMGLHPDLNRVDRSWATFTALYAWFLGLQLLDLLTTGWVLLLGGVEANPYGPRQVDAVAGIGGLVVMKLLLLLLSLAAWVPAAAVTARRGGDKVVAGLLLVLVVWYTLVIFHNLTVVARLSG